MTEKMQNRITLLVLFILAALINAGAWWMAAAQRAAQITGVTP